MESSLSDSCKDWLVRHATAMRHQSSAIPRATAFLAGRIDLHRDGYAFVRPTGSANREDDLFIPPNELNGAMQGDEVLVDEAPRGRDGAALRPRGASPYATEPDGGRNLHYARSHRRSQHEDLPLAKGNYVTPFDERMTQPILIEEDDEIVPVAAITPHRVLGDEAQEQKRRWTAEENPGPRRSKASRSTSRSEGFPSPGRTARGRVFEVLGPPDDFGVDVEIVIRKHHLPHVFPANVLTEAQDSAQQTVGSLLRKMNSQGAVISVGFPS